MNTLRIPKINKKIIKGFFLRIWFFENINHIPKDEKINSTVWKVKDVSIEVVWCSAIESTMVLLVVKNGLIAFQYLNE